MPGMWPNQWTLKTKLSNKMISQHARAANTSVLSDTEEDNDIQGDDEDVDTDEDVDVDDDVFPGYEAAAENDDVQFDVDFTDPAGGEVLHVDEFDQKIATLLRLVTKSGINNTSHCRRLNLLSTRFNSTWDNVWRQGLSTITELTGAQGNPAWFILRVGVFTSSASYAIMHSCLPTLLVHPSEDVRTAATNMSEFIDKAPESKDHDAEGFTCLSPDQVDDMKVEDLKAYAARMNVARNLLHLTKVKTSRKKAELADALKEAAIEMADSIIDEGLTTTAVHEKLIKSWFLKRVNEKKCPSLTIGRNNEPHILQHMTQFLYQMSKRYMLVDMLQPGLVERKDKIHICTSTDSLVLVCDLDVANSAILVVPVELKTVTTADTIAKARAVRQRVGAFVHCSARAPGTCCMSIMYIIACTLRTSLWNEHEYMSLS